MIKERSFEYDAFGPWVYEIRGDHKLPPLFAEYEQKLRGAEMCFKIPRNIDRADASPGMNLYDLVVGIFENEVVFLERKGRPGKEYAQLDRISAEQICSLHKYNCLLRGSLTIHTVERSISFTYNTVSEELIDKAVRLIRDLRHYSRSMPDFEVLPYDSDSMEFMFVNLTNKILQDDPSLKLIAYQASLFLRIPRQFKWEFLNRFGITEQALSSFAVFCNSGELVIIHRYFFKKRKPSEAYARNYYYIPMDAIQEMSSFVQSSAVQGLSLKTVQMDLFLKADVDDKALISMVESISSI